MSIQDKSQKPNGCNLCQPDGFAAGNNPDQPKPDEEEILFISVRALIQMIQTLVRFRKTTFACTAKKKARVSFRHVKRLFNRFACED
jgi:hypothetical protein